MQFVYAIMQFVYANYAPMRFSSTERKCETLQCLF